MVDHAVPARRVVPDDVAAGAGEGAGQALDAAPVVNRKPLCLPGVDAAGAKGHAGAVPAAPAALRVFKGDVGPVGHLDGGVLEWVAVRVQLKHPPVVQTGPQVTQSFTWGLHGLQLDHNALQLFLVRPQVHAEKFAQGVV
ncbi:MAG: hypothetical protein PWR31_17 [Bacillota bacterium]|nr:hypothetical protein [Bacillota bacterium]